VVVLATLTCAAALYINTVNPETRNGQIFCIWCFLLRPLRVRLVHASRSRRLWVMHDIPAIAACPVRPKSGHSAKAGVQPESRSLVRLSYATELRVVAATALLAMWSRSFSTSFTRPWLTS